MNDQNLPLGAAQDIRAPYNQPDSEEFTTVFTESDFDSCGVTTDMMDKSFTHPKSECHIHGQPYEDVIYEAIWEMLNNDTLKERKGKDLIIEDWYFEGNNIKVIYKFD
jgi:hypothetical protein